MVQPTNGFPDNVLDVTVELIAEHGVSGVTVDTVAARAGVSKATIYRRWGSRAALIQDAAQFRLKRPETDWDTGILHDDLILLLKDLVAQLNHPGGGRVDASFVEASSRDPGLAAVRRETTRKARAAYTKAIGRAIARGELDRDVDVELFIDIIVSPFLYRRLIDHTPAREADIKPVVDAAIRAFRPG